MYLNLNDRQERSCPSGTQWYVCVANSFTGCCSVDACDLPTCPDTISSSSSVISSPSATSSILTSSSTSAPSPTSQNAVTASTTSAAPSETTTVVVDTPSPTPKGPIIAGVICGIVVLAIFTAMLWFFCRRRRQLNELARSSPLVGSNGSEKFAMDHSIDEEAQRHSGGIFAPFGGYHKTPSMEARESTDRSIRRSLDIATVEPRDTDADAPIPDPEKSTLVAPPAHEHPAYHPLPGQTPNVPVYSLSQHSAHPASRSVSTRDPAYNSLPSQSPKRSQSYAHPSHAYDSLPSQSPPEPTYDPRSQHPRAPRRAELQSPDSSPIKIVVPEESPELPALTFSPISLDTDTHNTPGTTYQFPSPSENAPIPRFSSPIDRAPSITARISMSSPSQVGRAIEEFRPTPLTAAEIAEIGTSMSPFRPTPLSAGDIAELGTSHTPFRPTPISEVPENSVSSSPPPATKQSEHTEYPFQTPPIATSTSEQPGFTPFRTPSLSRVTRNLTNRRPSFKGKSPEIPSMPPLPNLDGSPTPPPLKFKKRSAERPTLPAVSTSYTPPKKPTPAKDLPFNYISLPSPQSPSSPSAIQSPSSRMDAIARTGSATTTYSIPIGLARSHKRQNTDNSAKTVISADEGVRLTHNHSREWSESDREHVMSWATYNGPDSPLMEGDEAFSPMIEQVARAEKVERMEMVQPVQVQGGKLLRKKSPQEELRSELDGREVKRKSTQQASKESEKEGQKSPTKPELRRTSRISFREKMSSFSSSLSPKQEGSPKQESKRDSHKSEKMTVSPSSERMRASPRSDGREEVSPLFTPIQSGHKFSPLTPEERKLAGQNFYFA